MDRRFIHTRDAPAGQAGDPLLFEVSHDNPGDPGIMACQQSGLRLHEGDPDRREALSPPRVHGEGQLRTGRSAARNDDPQGLSVGAVVFLELVDPSQQLAEGSRGHGAFPHAGGVHAPGNRSDID